MDIPDNPFAMLQMGGTVERLGQRKDVTIEILGTDRTFDVARKAMLALRFRTIFAGLENRFNLWARCDDMTDQSIVDSLFEEVVRRMLGHSYQREPWKGPDGTAYAKRIVFEKLDPRLEEADKMLAVERENFKLVIKEADRAKEYVGQGLKVELLEIDPAGE